MEDLMSEPEDLLALARERNARLDAFRDGLNARTARLREIFSLLEKRLEAVASVLSDAHVISRTDPRTLRSMTLKFGALAVRTTEVGRLEAVMGAALHFAESTGGVLICVIHPFQFRDIDEEPQFNTARDPLKWDLDAELPSLVKRFLDVAEESHPYRGVEGDTATEEAVPGAFPGLPPEEDSPASLAPASETADAMSSRGSEERAS